MAATIVVTNPISSFSSTGATALPPVVAVTSNSTVLPAQILPAFAGAPTVVTTVNLGATPGGTTSTAVMSASQLGMNNLILLDKTGQGNATHILVLPSPVQCQGVRIKLKQSSIAVANAIWQIRTGTAAGQALFAMDVIQGPVGGLLGVVGSLAYTTITFAAASAASDGFEIVSDGVKWWGTAMSTITVGITIA